jgi:UDP-galactopyranose mutase
MEETMSFDLVVFSHLRWDFVYQRPQHLLSRAARERRVLFIEEPLPSDEVRFTVRRDASGVAVCTPHLPGDLEPASAERLLQQWVETLVESQRLSNYAVWFYTPMMLPLMRHLKPKSIIYDCMDELSLFKGAPKQLIERERELLKTADVVFTGGYSLYESKRNHHANVHAMPSSVDALHFGQARNTLPEPSDMAHIPHPRVGFVGVIDERMDLELLAGMAQLRPNVQFVMVGPVVKIDPATLPQAHNIHYLGGRSYNELPAYLAHWDVAMLPFALNESTRFISPTKTPEYLAAGKPVVSTPIRDVVRPYGEQDIVQIAESAEEFVHCLDLALHEDQTERCARADKLIGGMSWDLTWRKMEGEVSKAILKRTRTITPALGVPTKVNTYPGSLAGLNATVPASNVSSGGGSD